MTPESVIFIGTSAGGISALQILFTSLPEHFENPVIVAQHLPATAEIDLDLIFRSLTGRRFEEAVDKTPIEKNCVYFAPPGYHLLVEKTGHLSLTQDEPVYYARPSIDVLFESAAQAYGPKACGILLTGANPDGAAGLKAIHDCGGQTMVQDPETAEAPTMPKAALALFEPGFVGDLAAIAQNLSVTAPGGLTT